MNYEIELNAGGLEVEIMGLRGLVTLTGLLLLGAAIWRELALPPTERSWHGTLFGRVPYDLRPPTIQRLVSSVWRPSDQRVLVPTAFGVGWTINLAALGRATVVS
jgi:hypothetical protein